MSPAPTTNWSPRSTRPSPRPHAPATRSCANRLPPVDVVARPPGPQDPRGLLRSASVEKRSGNEAPTCSACCATPRTRTGSRFTDDDIVSHMIFVMMAAHDTSTSTMTTMAYHLAANPEWQDRCRDESDRHRRRPAGHRGAGEAGNLRPGDERVAADGDPAAVGIAPGGARHRPAWLLHPQGHQRDRLPPA